MIESGKAEHSLKRLLQKIEYNFLYFANSPAPKHMVSIFRGDAIWLANFKFGCSGRFLNQFVKFLSDFSYLNALTSASWNKDGNEELLDPVK